MRIPGNLRNYVQNEKGIALYVVLMVLVIISVLGLGIMGLTLNNAKMSSNEHNQQSAYYIAEAGATKALNEISKQATCPPNLNKWDNKTYTFEKSFGEIPNATIKIGAPSKVTDVYTYNLTSTGEIGRNKRSVKNTFSLNCGSNNQDQDEESNVPIEILNDVAVFSNGVMEMITGVGATDSIGTNANSITIGYGMENFKGTIKAPNAQKSMVNMPYGMPNFKPTFTRIEKRNYILPPFPEFERGLPNEGTIHLSGGASNDKKIILNKNLYFNEIKLESGRTLTIDLNGQDRTIQVKNLNVSQGFIKIIGTQNNSKKLTLKIEENFSVTGSSTVNTNANSKDLNIFYKGSKELNFGGSVKIYGSLYAKSANMVLTGSGAINSHIIMGGNKLTIEGGSSNNSKLILAPNAHVLLTGGGKVYGSIISNTFRSDGGASIEFEKFEDDELIPYYPPTENNEPGDSKPIIEPGPIREQG
ncbi:pilus assembly PilX N-terminal domain-containing protein [Bacillus sp. REN16]|uniref:pilus assembly PilX N-terminal domain-containing protein n=1 Tax=Bacillus sp. REN16 TaxID=2887296 RepID=UPI001E56192A|nr:pilus assembly PilX N-terminal domain-containing protein [Bacillus sp. REN16]MCC3356543.1 pilus assembly PilX N-terminal domain-containing protein [Bacillus sp. REN16]